MNSYRRRMKKKIFKQIQWYITHYKHQSDLEYFYIEELIVEHRKSRFIFDDDVIRTMISTLELDEFYLIQFLEYLSKYVILSENIIREYKQYFIHLKTRFLTGFTSKDGLDTQKEKYNYTMIENI